MLLYRMTSQLRSVTKCVIWSQRTQDIMSDHVIRRATVHDFEKVMAIGDVHLGVDYLEQRYHSFIKDRKTKCYIYSAGGKVIGFCAAFLIDDGSTLLVRAARVKDGFRGQGVYGKLMRRVFAEFRSLGTVKHQAMVTENTNYEINKASIDRSYRKVCEKAILWYRFKSSDIEIPSTADPLTQEVTSQQEVGAIVADDHNMFKDGFVLVDWVPLRTVASNVRFLTIPRTIVLKTQNQAGIRPTCMVTFGTWFVCQLGLLYVVDVYGHDLTNLHEQVTRHVHNAKTLTGGHIFLQIVLDTEWKVRAENILANFKIPPFDFPTKMMYHFEKEFS